MNDRAVSFQELLSGRQAEGFVGREEQLGRFAANLALPVLDPRRRFVFCVHGDGGVGKTFLLRRLQRIATEHGYATAAVGESIFTVPDAMREIANQVAAQGFEMNEFQRLAENYRRHRSEIEADPHAPTGVASFLTRTATRVGFEALRSVPGVGALTGAVDGEAVADQADHLRTFLGAKLRHDDLQLLLSPVEALAPAFVRGLNAGRKRPPLAIFVDTYEETGGFLDGWLRALLEGRYGQLPAEILITIAGRDPVDPGEWSPYLNLMANVPLVPFDEGEVRRLLASKAVTDERVIEVILRLSGGLPLLAAMLAEQQPADASAVGDPTGDAVERFLKWERDPEHRALAVTAALPRHVNEDVLSALLEGDADARAEFAWLRSLSFVHNQAGRWQYHSVVRSAMLRMERGQSPMRWRTAHERMAAYYRTLRLASSATAAWDDEAWRELRLEESYHELCAGSPRAIPEALEGVIFSLREASDVAASAIHALKQAAQDTDSPGVRKWASRLAEAPTDDQGVAIAGLLVRDADLASAAKAEAYRLRGRGYLRRNDYEDALADFNRAVELDPGSRHAIADRGATFSSMGRHEEALSDFDRALELKPDSLWSLAGRGETYSEMGRYEEALLDFDRALELDPDYLLALTWRAGTYALMGRSEDALAALTRVIELEPENVLVLVARGLSHQGLGHFAEALADLDRAVDLEPERADIVYRRGFVHFRQQHFEEALADYNRALELDPEYVEAMVERGTTLHFMRRFDEALADFDRAVRLRPGDARAVAARGGIYRSLGRLEEALAEATRAVELEPEDPLRLLDRGLTLQLLGRYTEALADFSRAIESGLERAEPFTWRGQTYEKLRRYEEALADFDRALELDPDNASVLCRRGQIHKKAGRYEEALADFDRACVLTPDVAELLGIRGETRMLVGRFQEALADFQRAVELDPPPDRVHLERLTTDLTFLARVPGMDRGVVSGLLDAVKSQRAVHYQDPDQRSDQG